MDTFEQKEMKKLRPIKNTSYDWLINYIPDPIRKRVGGFKDKIVSLFKTKTTKQTVYGRKSEEKISGIIIIMNMKKEYLDKLKPYLRDIIILKYGKFTEPMQLASFLQKMLIKSM